MKVKTWIRKYVNTYYIANEKAKKLLHDNGIYDLDIYKEEILDIDMDSIVDIVKGYKVDEAGYIYCNRLYDLVHSKSRFFLERDDLEYEIIEDGYPEDIPYADCIFDSVEEFHKWMLEEGKKEELGL